MFRALVADIKSLEERHLTDPILYACFPPVCACFFPLLVVVTCRALVSSFTETSQTLFQYDGDARHSARSQR